MTNTRTRTCQCGQDFTPTTGQIDRGHGKYCSRVCFDRARRHDRIAAACPCGGQFETTAQKQAQGKGRYCSKACMYRHRVRPRGLTYEVKAQNKAWFKPGHEAPAGPQNPQWKGDAVGYRELHRWVRRVRGAPGACEDCGANGYTEWANKSHLYRRDPSDWIALCKPCHGSHDSGPNRGAAVAKYGRNGLR